jgi:hypothetical protein
MICFEIKMTWLTAASLKGDVAYADCRNAPVHR